MSKNSRDLPQNCPGFYTISKLLMMGPITILLFIYDPSEPIFKYMSSVAEKVFYSGVFIFYDFNSISYKGKDF